MFWAMSTLISVTTPLLTFYMVIDVAVSTRIDFTIPFLHFHIVIPMEKLKKRGSVGTNQLYDLLLARIPKTFSQNRQDRKVGRV